MVTHGVQNRSQEPAEPQDAETKTLALADEDGEAGGSNSTSRETTQGGAGASS